MNIYIREMRSSVKAVVIWSFGMIFLVAAGMGKYSVAADSGVYTDLLKDMPQSLQNLLGVGVFDLSRAIDFYAVVYPYIAFLLATHAVLLGASILSKEERDKTTEFLLVKPVKRSAVLTAKLLAAASQILILLAVTWGISAVVLNAYDRTASFGTPLIRLIAAGLGLQIPFLCIGFFFAGILNRPRLASNIGSGIMLSMFTIGLLVDMIPETAPLRFFTFFQYYDPKDILIEGYWWGYPAIAAGISAVLLLFAYRNYNRRDMRV